MECVDCHWHASGDNDVVVDLNDDLDAGKMRCQNGDACTFKTTVACSTCYAKVVKPQLLGAVDCTGSESANSECTKEVYTNQYGDNNIGVVCEPWQNKSPIFTRNGDGQKCYLGRGTKQAAGHPENMESFNPDAGDRMVKGPRRYTTDFYCQDPDQADPDPDQALVSASESTDFTTSISGFTATQSVVAVGGVVWSDRNGYFFQTVPDEIVGATLFVGPHKHISTGTVIQITVSGPAILFVSVEPEDANHASRDGGLESSLPNAGFERLNHNEVIGTNHGSGDTLHTFTKTVDGGTTSLPALSTSQTVLSIAVKETAPATDAPTTEAPTTEAPTTVAPTTATDAPTVAPTPPAAPGTS